MTALRISLFGRMQIAHDHYPAEEKSFGKAQALLAYLLLKQRRFYPREMLAHLFWGDQSESKARSCLSTTLWRLRRLLEPEGVSRGTYLLTTDAGEIGFNWESDHWLDVVIFEKKVEQILKKPVHAVAAAETQKLEETLQLHTGELLEGFYDDWALRERERLHQLYLRGLAYMMHYHHHHQAYEQSLTCGRQILGEDPLRENIHREMMRLHWEQGCPALAVRQYHTCREILAAELGIPPMEETQALYQQIISADNFSLPPTVAGENSLNLRHALAQLRQATLEFKRAQQKLEEATRLVERAAAKQTQAAANHAVISSLQMTNDK